MSRFLLIAMFALVAGCAQLPPSPAEMQAKKFESVPGKAVIYIARPSVGFDGHGALTLDDSMTITMFGGNFYRWEVEPGPHLIAGAGQDMSRLTVNAEAGKIYFVQHTVMGTFRTVWGWGGTLRLVPEPDGRMMVERARLVGNG
jgi:hypothetical protein